MTNVRYNSNYTPFCKNIQLPIVNKVVSFKDSQDKEYDYAKKKFQENIDLVDLEARNYFGIGVTISILKWIYSFNYYYKRYIIINKEIVDTEYMRYNKREN